MKHASPTRRSAYLGVRTSALDRSPVRETFDTGVRALNALTTFGIGQRIGVMAGSGVGKSVLIDMIARGSSADIVVVGLIGERARRSEEHTSDIQSLMRISYAGFCLKKKKLQ